MTDADRFRRDQEALTKQIDKAVSAWKKSETHDVDQFIVEPMTDAVNALRSRRGLGPIPMSQVRAVDTFCSGHSDYGSKFALYCAELVSDRLRLDV